VGALFWLQDPHPLPMPETVQLATGTQDNRPSAEFRQGTRVVDAPVDTIAAPAMDVM